MAVKLWSSLTKLQQAVCFLHHAPVGPAEYVTAWRAVFADELVEIAGRLRGPSGGDPVGAVGPQVVLETREIRPRTQEEIGKLLGLSPTKAARELKKAFRALELHPLYKALRDGD
jgi:hypothetical protein